MQCALCALDSLKFGHILFYVDNVTSAIIIFSLCTMLIHQVYDVENEALTTYVNVATMYNNKKNIIVSKCGCIILASVFQFHSVAVLIIQCIVQNDTRNAIINVYFGIIGILVGFCMRYRFSECNSHTKNKHLRLDYLIDDAMPYSFRAQLTFPSSVLTSQWLRMYVHRMGCSLFQPTFSM